MTGSKSQWIWGSLVTLSLFLALGSSRLPAQQPSTDTTALRAELQKTATEYERIRKNSAPHRLMQNAFCDEKVGRYCIVYDVGTSQALPPEPEQVKQARAKAIDAFKRGFALWPADTLVAGPLVRYLIENAQPKDALTVAQQHTDVSPNRHWAIMVQGLALHSMADDSTAESAFASVLQQQLPFDRVRMRDVAPLLARDEEERYRALAARDRARYQERLWNLADPLFLTAGNESLTEHFARQIYGRILAVAPAVDNLGWGPDAEILTLRFGVPTTRTRNYGQGSGGISIVEHFPPTQLTYVPPAAITKGALTVHEPGSAWPYDTIRSRSGYAPLTFRWMQVLEHQIARYPGATAGTVRVDFQFKLDSIAPRPARVEVGLFLLDSMAQVVGTIRDTVVGERDLISARLSAPLTAGVVAYSVEALELGSRQAGRARYNFPVSKPGRLAVADLVILSAGDAAPPKSKTDAAFQPFSSLRIPRGQPIALYVEARGLKPAASKRVRYRVDLEVLEQSSPGTFTRAVRSLGRLLGVAGDPVAPRVTWTEEQPAADLTVIALKLGAMQLEPGVKQFRLTLTDLETQAATVIERLIRVE
ncbi:MAG: hypothetical protein WEE89_00635 [Gemmatimonadota bacterium]